MGLQQMIKIAIEGATEKLESWDGDSSYGGIIVLTLAATSTRHRAGQSTGRWEFAILLLDLELVAS